MRTTSCSPRRHLRRPDPDGAGPGQPGAAADDALCRRRRGQNLLRFTLSAEGRVTQYIYNAYGQQTSTIAYGAAAYDTSALGATGVPTEAQMTTWVGTQDRTRRCAPTGPTTPAARC